jgi:hypothetical protein
VTPLVNMGVGVLTLRALPCLLEDEWYKVMDLPSGHRLNRYLPCFLLTGQHYVLVSRCIQDGD